MKLMIHAVILLLCLMAISAQADPFYVNVTATQLEVKTDVDSAKPYVSALKLGYRFSQDYALEAQYGTHSKEDDFGTGKLKADKLSALFLRIGGQTNYNDVRLYLLVGRSKTEVTYKDGVTKASDKFEANAWGIGAEEYSKAVKNMAYVLEYIRYNSDSDNKVTGISLGLRYDF